MSLNWMDGKQMTDEEIDALHKRWLDTGADHGEIVQTELEVSFTLLAAALFSGIVLLSGGYIVFRLAAYLWKML